MAKILIGTVTSDKADKTVVINNNRRVVVKPNG